MEPLIAAATDELEELRSDIRDGLASQTTATLNWAPHAGGNTIAGLLAHMLESAQFLLRVGRGETPTRDRDAQFLANTPDASALLAAVDGGFDAIVGLLHGYTAADLAARYPFREREMTGARFVLRVCDHLHEHWGQIQTTRDLAEQRPPG